MLEYVDHGIRLSPRDPETSIFLLLKGWAYLVMEHDDEALVWLRRAAAASPEIPTILAALIRSWRSGGRPTVEVASAGAYGVTEVLCCMRANRKVRSAGLEGGSDSFPLGRELRCSVCKNVRFATPKSGRSVIPLWRLPRLDISAELLRSPSAPPVQFRTAVRTLIQQLFAVGPLP